MLTCISGVDLLSEKHRFLIVYELLSLVFNSRLRLKIFVDDTIWVPTIIDIFINSNWWEREIWDLFGIYFEKHPDLRRILNDYSFEGHPMRKDFPLSGFVEVHFSQQVKLVKYDKIHLTQESRIFV